MATVATVITNRHRLRVGRDVMYMPTAAEATSYGAGPWPGRIIGVNASGTTQLRVDLPTPTIAAAVAVDLPTVIALANEMKTDTNGAIKSNVRRGGGLGQYTVAGLNV